MPERGAISLLRLGVRFKWLNDKEPGRLLARKSFANPASPSHRRRWKRPVVIGAILVYTVWMFGFGVFLVDMSRLSDSAQTAANETGSAQVPTEPEQINTGSGLMRSGSRIGPVDPKAAVLSMHELPGYKLISSAEAVRPGGGTQPNSWDNLFQKSGAGAPNYRMTEAIVVVYGSAAEAMAALDQLRQAEESQRAKPLPGLAASPSSATWLESVGIPGYTLVRVIFRIDRVVAQVAILGPVEPALAGEAQYLAGAQQARLLSLLQESI